MIKNYLLITLRSLLKNKLFIIINVFGMGIAIACCVVAYVNWDFAARWDNSHLNADRIYRVQFWHDFQGRLNRYGIAPMPLGDLVRENVKDVSRVVRYMPTGGDIRIGDELFNAGIVYADSAFFDLFTYELKYGTFDAFHDRSKMFISDEVALKYFDREDVVGEQVTQIFTRKDGQQTTREFTIGGVFTQQPYNSSFRFEAITLWDNFWEIVTDPLLTETSWKRWNTLFLKIDDPALVGTVTAQLQQYVEPQNIAREDLMVKEYYLENFAGLMERSRTDPRLNNEWLRGGIPREAITVPAIMAFMLLLLACFNFTNTSIAISSRRLKEIGIRKVMGGMRSQLIFQFLGENLLLCFCGLAVGLLLAEWLVPAYDSLWPWLTLTLNYTENASFILFLAGLLFITAIIAGSYPAFYITSFEPVSILKGTARFGGTSWFTRGLLGGQFFISLLSVIMGVAFYMNGQYQKEYDLGFSTSGVISSWVDNEAGFNTFRDALAGNKDIELIAGTRNHVTNNFYNDPVTDEGTEREVDILDVGDHYLEALSMTVTSGRAFTSDSETDRKESILVSEEFVKEFGWTDDPVGKRVVWMDTVQLFVIGVVKSVYARALWERAEPLMIRYTSPDKYQQLIVKTSPQKVVEVNEFMQKKWKEVFPNTVYNGEMVDESMEETAQINDNVTLMFGFLGFFAALMTGIGLYTLVSLNIVKRMKEIGVRKVLGASLSSLARVINFEFIINLGIASLFGGAAGYLAANWLMGTIWNYYLKLGYTSLALSVMAMVVIAILSVGYKTITTASLNPTKTLRDE